MSFDPGRKILWDHTGRCTWCCARVALGEAVGPSLGDTLGTVLGDALGYWAGTGPALVMHRVHDWRRARYLLWSMSSDWCWEMIDRFRDRVLSSSSEYDGKLPGEPTVGY
jgi:hypothetical protein